MTSTGLFKFLRPKLRPQSTDIQAAATWGVAATTTALWIVQVLSFFTFFFQEFWNLTYSYVLQF